MESILIGISAPINNASRDAVSVLTEEFNVEHFNLRQPVIDMVAALTKMHPTHQEFCCEPHQVIENLGISHAELELLLAFQLRVANPAFFIERLKIKIQHSMHGMHNELFNGNLVSGVKTELEAQWIRDQGGLVVHLHQLDNKTDFHALRENDCDLVCNITNARPTRNNMPATISAIQARINHMQKAA